MRFGVYHFISRPVSSIKGRARHVCHATGQYRRPAGSSNGSDGLTIEPQSQIGHSFTFRGLGSRLVVTKTASGIEVFGTSGLINGLTKDLGVMPQKTRNSF